MDDVPKITDRVDELGDYLREQREGARLSVRQLASLTGVSNPYLSQVERGLRKPSAEVLQQIANGLRISAEALYIRAGILDSEGRPDVEAAIGADPHLNERQRRALLDIYASFIAENSRAAGSDDVHVTASAPVRAVTKAAVKSAAAKKAASQAVATKTAATKRTAAAKTAAVKTAATKKSSAVKASAAETKSAVVTKGAAVKKTAAVKTATKTAAVKTAATKTSASKKTSARKGVARKTSRRAVSVGQTPAES